MTALTHTRGEQLCMGGGRRKFQVPGDNSVDLFTNDLGVVVICDAAGNLQGANIYAGGGLGRTHRNNDTAAMLVRVSRRTRPASAPPAAHGCAGCSAVAGDTERLKALWRRRVHGVEREWRCKQRTRSNGITHQNHSSSSRSETTAPPQRSAVRTGAGFQN